MIEMIIAFAVLVAVVAAMSVGVMMGRKPLKGSCGGVGTALGEEDYVCEICGGDPDRCEEQQGAEAELAYDATRGDSR